jgi:putative heme-binding domain-containing protein
MKLSTIVIGSLLAVTMLNGQRPSRSQPPPGPADNPYKSAADVDLGRKLYTGRCGQCHGMNGEGGRGAVLNTGEFRHGGSDRELYRVIRSGIPNTEMPGSFILPEADVWRIVAFVKQLGSQGVAANVPPGDVAAGAAVYEKNGCAGCHAIGAKGAYFGPDLTSIGVKRSVRHLRDAVVNPNADIPLDYRTVQVVMPDGKTASGIHLNEDEYSIHLRAMNGDLLSYRKSDIKEVRLPRSSTMPAYTLSAADLDNLVAYLSSLGRTGQQ